ncbi:PspA/IM30 family protein [Sphingobacterium sp.]|uniref:PspA/IM30 family protein n=1 Tax=Sphingobacterium sp. TaxID=341027 RepID=UPI00289F661B|nr:PspA/IM30 family protein [Sphingobacterium sp.]
MNIFKRLLKIGQSEIHSLVEKMEDPIALTQEVINDMKGQLLETEELYLSARAVVIRLEHAIDDRKAKALIYEEKAEKVLLMAQNRELSREKAESLAIEALRLQKQLLDESEEFKEQALMHNKKVEEIEDKIDVLKFNIGKWKKELDSLIAKKQINSATEFANRQMANIDNNSTVDMLKKLRSTDKEDEAYAEAINELAKQKMDQDIDYALESVDSVKKDLEKLKKKLGL